MAVKVSKLVKVTTFESDDCVLSVGSQSATISNFDKNNKLSEFMCVPKEILDVYAENYLAENFELTENDGWVRILKGDEKRD